MADRVIAKFDNSSSVLTNENLSGISIPGITEANYTYTERIILAILCLFISIFGSVGNFMVIIAVTLSRKLQTPTNAFVVSLTIADLSTSLFLISHVVTFLSPVGWPLPNAKWLCAVAGFMMLNCVGVSLMNLAAISLNRCVLITKPFKTYQKLYTPITIGFMVATTWLLPLGTALILINDVSYGYDERNMICNDYPVTAGSGFPLLCAQVSFLSSALVTIITSYVLVFRHVRRHYKKKHTSELNSVPSSSETGLSQVQREGSNVEQPNLQEQGQPTQRQPKGLNRMDLEVTKNLLIVVVGFFLCFMPFNIMLVFLDSSSYWLYGIVLVYANSCINPVIYACRHPHFKVVLRAMMKGQYQNIPEPSDTLRRFISRRIHPN